MKWVGYITDKSYDFNNKKQQFGIPSTYIVRYFDISEIEFTKIRIAVLGVFSLFVNGELVNDDYMSQDVSEYTKRVYYRDFNITKYLRKGTNSIGIILSDGWYASNLSIVGKNAFGDYPLKVCYKVFTKDEVICESDGSEVASAGAIRSCDNQNGINIDNNYDLGNFSDPNYDISNFKKVETYDIDVELKKSLIHPVKKKYTFKPTILKQGDGYIVYDFKQNFTGITRTVFKGNKGDQITIYHGEVLDENGEFYNKNLRSALARDTYILKGDGDEEFLPRHTFHGFRYIKIEYPKSVSIKLVEAYAFFTDMKQTGFIHTNNSLVNKIYKNVLWGQRSNFLSIPTDCPQRDERMGWTGDAQVFSNTAMLNYDSHAFLKKYVIDIMDSMDIYGDMVPSVCPHFVHRWGSWGGKPGWSDAIIIIPLNLYLYYGDKAFLKKCLPYMKRYLKYVKQNNIKNSHFSGESYGDWLSVFEVTDYDIYNDGYYAYDNYLVSMVCHILNNKSETRYLNEFNKVKKYFGKRYIENGLLKSDAQGAYILAYHFGLIDKEYASANLIRKVEQFGHLTTGFHSTKFLLPQLCEFGRSDLAYKLLARKEYPSWGYEISCGATTIWERWDSYRKDIGFNPDGMNSFNHYSLGSVAEWMYESMMGVSPTLDNPGFKATLVSPYFDKKVSKFKGELKTVNGVIKVQYLIKGENIVYVISADDKITLDFRFNNEVINKTKLGNNIFEFVLKY